MPIPGHADPANAQETLHERELLAGLIAAVGTHLVQGHDLSETLRRCCEAVVEHLGVAFARIWTLDKHADVLELQASAGMYTHLDGAHSRVPVGELKIGLIAQERKPHLTNQVIGDSRISDQDWVRREGMVAFAGYPLIVDDRLVGVIALFSREPLREATAQALAAVADGVALGIERHQAVAELREQTEVVETINRIGQLLAAELDQQRLVQAVTDAATELTGARFGAFFYNVYDEQGAAYMLYTLSGVPKEAFAHFPMPRATSLFGPTFRGEQTIRIDDVRKDPRYGSNSPYRGLPPGHLPVTSYLAVPVVSRSGEVIGGLFFGHPEPGVFTSRHERIVEGLASQAAVAMDNARLYSNAQAIIREREELLASEQEARREAEVANRAKDEFLGMLSHELRTPLNAILGWTRMLMSGQLDPQTATRAIETIERSARSQARLIDDMLDVSRIISGKLRLDVQPVDLSAAVNAAVDTSRPAADAKDIRIQMVMDFDAGPVLGDPVRLQQVIWNLLSNAIKFTPKHGRVQIHLSRVNSHVELTVSDTGPGIDQDFLPFVFERFRQADSSASRRHGGLGLGLAIVRHLVELHGGTVEAQNRHDGTGALFSVKLPIMAVRAAPGPLGPADLERVAPVVSDNVALDKLPSLSGLKLLVVDDESDARHLLKTVLERCGAEVRTCASASETISALEEYRPDVLVSDVGMPEVNGYSLIKKVRALTAAGGGRIPSVALTAYARVEDRLQAFAAGFDMHVPKPVEPAELALVIASLAGRTGIH